MEGTSLSRVDTANSIVSNRGVDGLGTVQLRPHKVVRTKLAAMIEEMPPCTIGIEYCSGAQPWARKRLCLSAAHASAFIQAVSRGQLRTPIGCSQVDQSLRARAEAPPL